MKARAMWAAAAFLAACSESGLPRPSEERVGVLRVEDSPGRAPTGPREPHETRAPLPPRVGKVELAYEPAGTRRLSEVASVELRLHVSGLQGRGTVDAEFLTPGASIYEKRTHGVEASPGETRVLPFSLPVAGTLIASQGLAGQWEVRFFLDGELLATTVFELER